MTNGAGAEKRQIDETVFSGENAPYLEKLFELYSTDPNAVPREWRAFFDGSGGGGGGAGEATTGPSWSRSDWPPKVNGDLTAAMDGNWPEAEAKVCLLYTSPSPRDS